MEDEYIHELWAMLSLQCTPLISNANIKHLIQYYGNATQSIQAISQSSSSWEMLGIGRSQIYSFTSGAWHEKAHAIWEEIQNTRDIHIVLSSSKHYPLLLKEIVDPPHILFCKGDISLLQHMAIAVVGTRKATSHGNATAFRLSKELIEYDFVVVSGLAEGIDAKAHEGALSVSNKTVAVLGNGVDVIYPHKNANLYKKIAEEGCLISEFSPKTPPKAIHFPIRNRIVSGMCLGVVVVEAGIKSGTMLTVKNALEQGRSVYTIPVQQGHSLSTGNAYLIEEGAIPICSATEIFEDLMPQLLHTNYSFLQAQKLVEYHLGLDVPKKDYFSDMLQLFSSSMPKNICNQPVEKPTPSHSTDTHVKQHIPQISTISRTVEDIVSEYALSDTAEKILYALRNGKATIEELVQDTQLPAGIIATEITLLEVQDIIEKSSGGYFTLIHRIQ